MQLKYSGENDTAKTTPLKPGEGIFLAGTSLEVQALQRLIAEIARTDIPVLLEGESGTGKEVAALQIHAMSQYSDLPFIKLSCAAFQPEVFRARLENLWDANQEPGGNPSGTLFLDEIGELDPNCQRHLLHSFPEGNGLPHSKRLAGRIVSCTTKDLESEVHEGRFRSELYYRLNGVCLRLPPLRR